MSLADILVAIQMIIAHLVGGSYTPSGGSAVTIDFSASWVGSFLSVFTTANGLLLISLILSFTLFGIHVLKSLMNR